MAKIDITYHNLLEKILQKGYTYEDPNRKGVNRIEIPSYTFRHEFKDGFPAITTKKLNYKSVVTELIWFLRGDTNIKYLLDNGCNIWNKDAYNYYLKSRTKEKYNDCYCGHTTDCECGTASIDNFIDGIKNGSDLGDLGPVYGVQWRKWDTKQSVVVRHNGSHNEFGTIIKDQISNLIKGLKERPLATDHIVNAWNVGDLEDMALPPCHYGFQVVVRPYYEPGLRHIADNNNLKSDKLGFELHWKQRSVDTFLGLNFNIASYATLALILEKITGYKALAIQGDLKKVHLYDNSLDAVKEQLSRNVDKYDNTNLLFKDEFHYITDKELVGNVSLNKIISEMKPDWFVLDNYESYPHIKVEMLSRNN